MDFIVSIEMEKLNINRATVCLAQIKLNNHTVNITGELYINVSLIMLVCLSPIYKL
jgi:hypothetical protein